MTQLFLKKQKTNLVVIFFSLFFFSLKPSLTLTKDPFLLLCENSDAYYEHSYTDITYAKNWLRYKRYVSIDNKLVVNTTKGVDDNAFLELDEFVSNHLQSMKVRVLKSDGSINELDSSLVFKKSSKKVKFNAIHYPIPAVEPGDTIETSYVYYENLKEHELLGYVDLYSEIPSVNSQYTIRTGKDLSVRYKSYNNFPEPNVLANDTMVYLQFSMDKIDNIVQNEFNCLPCEKPYLYYALENKDNELRSWKNVYNLEFNFLTQPMDIDYHRSSYYKRWKREVIGSAKDSSKYYKFNLLYDEVLKNFSMNTISENELIKSSGFFLKEKRFDPMSIRRFYRQILEDLDIDYWAVFAREKRRGSIDKHLIRKGEFGHVFFAFENENGHLKFLYPHEDYYMYQIDEIPTSLYGTEAVIVKPYVEGKIKRRDKFISRDLELAEVDSVAVEMISLPRMNSNFNYINQTIFSNVNLDEKSVSSKYMFKVSGGLSTEIRSFYDMLYKNQEVNDFYESLSQFEGDDNTIVVDTVTNRILNSSKPFLYSINAEGTLNNVVNFINDSLVSISLDRIIHHNQIENYTDSSKLSYYLDYSYSDYLLFNLFFPNEIEVLGIEDGNVKYKNEYGEYYFIAEKNDVNQLRIQSSYKILKDFIPYDELNELKIINEKVENAQNKRLIVKLKKNKA